MNIVEAAKTGKRFRRRGQLDWFPSPRFEGEEYYFNFEELVADDWELEPDTPRYTKEECLSVLALVRDSSRDLTVGMIDSIIYHLQNRSQP